MNTIKTKRLILRPFMEEDIDDFNEYGKSLKVGPNAGWKPHESKEESMKILKEFIGKKEAWAIVKQKSMKVIGSVGLHPDKRRDNPNTRNLGYVLNEKFWGKGYATEASFAALDYAFNILKVDLVSITHLSFNIASKRVVEKLGFLQEGLLRRAFRSSDGTIYDIVCYSMTQEEYFNKI